MYIDTYALGEAKFDAELSCGCMMCHGKSAISRDRAYDLPSTVRGTVPSSIRVDSDGRITGTISPGETEDVIGISVIAGQTYSVALRGVGDNGLDDPLLALFDQTGVLLNFDDDGGAGISSMLTFTATATDTYFLTAQSFAPGDFGDYTVDIWIKPPADEVPDTFAAAVEIEVGTTFGFIDASNDIDTYKIFLEAGKLYTFQLAAGTDYATDPLDVPAGEVDTILGIYAPDGTFIGFNDDIRFPTDISSGFSFLAPESGFYFLDALGYPDQTGGYTLDVTEVDPAQFDPLDSIDWESSNNVPTVLVNDVPTAYVYFGDSDENFGQTNDAGTAPMTTIDWNAFEKQQVMVALEEFERILGIDYVVTTDVNQATFRLLKTESEQYGAYFFPQDPAFGDDQGVGVFNVLSGGWTLPGQQSLQKGGFSFAVILHEFGHAHGLAHPHDTGGGSEIMLGVTAPTGSLGVFDLNQGVYTVMSYNDAFQLHPDGPTPYTRANIDSGWSGTLSAFDIAVLQERYGVVARNTGNDVYRMGDTNDQGTFYSTIWDSAGTDEIRYDGARAAQIDLTAATLDYSPTGGGVVSFVDDIFGGYTIAGGVTIENATGGRGNDALLGNAVGNVLQGNAGNDTLQGRGGDDTLRGGAGDDVLDGGEGVDTADFADGPQGVTASLVAGTATGAGADKLTGIENLRGSRGDDVLTGNAGANRVKGETGNDRIDGGAGNDQLFGDGGDDTVIGGLGDDEMDGGAGVDTIDFNATRNAVVVDLSNKRAQNTGAGTDTISGFENLRGTNLADTLTGDGAANRVKGEGGADRISGLGGNDQLFGDGGDDVLNGGGGTDTLAGGAGVDRFVFDSLDGDVVSDWSAGEKIDLTALGVFDFSIISRGGRATVSFDRDGDGQFDDGFFTVVVGSQGFSASDLVLL